MRIVCLNVSESNSVGFLMRHMFSVALYYYTDFNVFVMSFVALFVELLISAFDGFMKSVKHIFKKKRNVWAISLPKN